MGDWEDDEYYGPGFTSCGNCFGTGEVPTNEMDDGFYAGVEYKFCRSCGGQGYVKIMEKTK